MELKDLFLGPMYFFVILFFALIYRARLKDQILKKYFIPALVAKLLGAIALGLIYQFYYGRGQPFGDTFVYFTFGSSHIFQAFQDSPYLAFKLLLQEGTKPDPDTMAYSSRMYFFGNPSTYFIVKLSGLFGLLSFHTYIVNAMFFAIFSFTGIWKMYQVFYRLFPHLHRQLAISIFFIPSLIFWGSGILKDSVCLGVLGWFFYSFYNFFIAKRKIIRSIVIMVASIFIIKIIKVYIILCFIPAAVIWLFMNYNDRIKSRKLRLLLKPVFLVFAVSMGLVSAAKISEDNVQYKMENLQHTAKSTAEWIQYSTRNEGSTYDLGNTDFSMMGVIKKIPSAIWVSLFRPYLWEVRNVVMLISSLESLFLFIFTFLTIRQVGLLSTFSIIRENPIVFFCIIFALTFGLGVGMATYNFGTLSRYKIPLLPFYTTAIYLIRDIHHQRVKMRRATLK